MGVFTGSCVLTRSPTRYGTHGTESYTSFLRRCFCTAFCCRPRTRVSSLMVQARYSIDTFSLTHKLWQRTHRRVATLLRTDTPCSPTAASTSCCHHMAEIDTQHDILNVTKRNEQRNKDHIEECTSGCIQLLDTRYTLTREKQDCLLPDGENQYV